MTPNELIAVSAENANVAGAISYWRLSGTCSVEALTEAVVAIHETLRPSPPGNRAALQRAVNTLKARDLFPRRIPRGWALVRETGQDNGSLHHEVEMTAVLDPDEGLKVEGPGTEGEALKAAFVEALETFTQVDMSLWLGRVVMSFVDGVSLRETGGIYFVPQRKMEDFRKVIEIVKTQTAHTVYTIPSMRSEDAVEAILDAVLAEARQTMKLATDKVEDAGIRNLDTRKGTLEALTAKLGRYADLLGNRLDVLDEELEKAEKTVAFAALQAMAKKDKAASAK